MTYLPPISSFQMPYMQTPQYMSTFMPTYIPMNNPMSLQMPEIIPPSDSTLTQNAADSTASNFNLSKGERKNLEKTANIFQREETESLPAVLETAGIWTGASAAANARFSEEAIASDKFLELSGDKLKYDNLFKNYSELTSDAMKTANKLQKKFNKDLKRLERAGLDTTGLKNSLASYDTRLTEALNEAANGNIRKLVKLQKEMEAAKKVKNGGFARLFRKKENKILSREAVAGQKIIKNSAEIEKAVAATGAGKAQKILTKNGMGGAGLMFGLTMLSERHKIKEAYEYDKETGRKQLVQSSGKAGASAVLFTVGDNIGRNAANKYIVPKMAKYAGKKIAGKAAGKAVGKVAGKLSGKAIGSAIGSYVPVVGTAVGFIVGCILDFAFSKWISPAIFGKDDALTIAKTKNMSQDELLDVIMQGCLEGKKLDHEDKSTLKKYLFSMGKQNEYFAMLETNESVQKLSNRKRKKYLKNLQAQQALAEQQMNAQMIQKNNAA